MGLHELGQLGLQQQRAEFERQRAQAYAGLGQQQAGLQGQAAAAHQQKNLQSRAFVDRAATKIKYKPTIEAGDPVREVLQAETDEWLKDI